MKIEDPTQSDFTKHLPLEIREHLNHPVMLLGWLAELNPDAVQSYLSDKNAGCAVAAVSP